METMGQDPIYKINVTFGQVQSVILGSQLTCCRVTDEYYCEHMFIQVSASGRKLKGRGIMVCGYAYVTYACYVDSVVL